MRVDGVGAVCGFAVLIKSKNHRGTLCMRRGDQIRGYRYLGHFECDVSDPVKLELTLLREPPVAFVTTATRRELMAQVKRRRSKSESKHWSPTGPTGAEAKVITEA